MYADLHTHTTASDGTLPPAELVHAAREAGMDYLAICDHDTVAGIAPAELAAKAAGLRFIAGVELSAEGPPGKCHLLGLGIDPAHPELVETLAEISRNRHARNVRMAERLAALGAPLTLADVTALAPPGANIGRPHFAHALIVRGYVSDMNEAFSRYLSDSGPAYVSKATLTPQESIHLIHAAGGLCFMRPPRPAVAAKRGRRLDNRFTAHGYGRSGSLLRQVCPPPNRLFRAPCRPP